MQPKRKFNFKLFFKIIFYVIAILVALYIVMLASGYKFDRYKNNFIKTGSIYLNSNPKDVKVFINGKQKAAKTPLKLGYLLPGNYEVKIEKDGYKAWQKNLKVEPGMVTSEGEVILFYNQVQKNDFSNVSPVSNFITNAAIDELLYWNNNEAYLQKASSTQAEKLFSFSDFNIENIDGGLNFSRLLIKAKAADGQESYYFCDDLKCSNRQNLNLSLSLNFSQGKITNDNNYPLLLAAENNLYAATNSLTKYYLDSKVVDFMFFNGKAYYLADLGDEVVFSSADPNGENKKVITTIAANLSQKKDFRLLVDNNKKRLYLISAGKKLFLVDTGKSSLEEIKTLSSDLNFENKNLLLIIDGSELKVLGKIEWTDEDKTISEVARYSSDPLFTQWILQTNHLIFIRDGILRTVEVRGSNEVDLYHFTKDLNANFVSISKNEAIVLDGGKLIKLTLCDKGSLINLW